MLMTPHVAQTMEVDFPPKSGNVVGRVEISRLTGQVGYAAVEGFYKEKSVYHKEVKDRISFRSHEERIQRVAKKAARTIRYDASLIFDLPSAVDLLT